MGKGKFGAGGGDLFSFMLTMNIIDNERPRDRIRAR